MIIYNIIFSESAAHIRDSLPEDRQRLLAQGLGVLARDPRTKVSSPIADDDNARSVALTQTLAVEYVISDGLMFVLVIHVVDSGQVLLGEQDQIADAS